MEKNNEKIWRWLKILIPLLFVLATVVYGYGRLNHRVEEIETEIVKVSENEKAIIGLTKDVEYIKKAVDRIEAKIDK